MNTISYKELKDWYVNNDDAKKLAKDIFGGKQPSIYGTGFYSAPSWNWGYQIGLVQVNGNTYEVVTQFGSVVAARHAHVPVLQNVAKDLLTLKEEMDDAITNYIAKATGTNGTDVDYSYINTEIDDAIEMLGGTPAESEF